MARCGAPCRRRRSSAAWFIRRRRSPYPVSSNTPTAIVSPWANRTAADPPRVEAFSKLLISAGLKAPVRPRIRDEIWIKLWGNLAFNPISALTGATLDQIVARPGLARDLPGMMLEAKDVAEALGVRFTIDVDRRIAGAAEVGAHKTSMLQDLERGRPMEIDALLGAVVEFGTLVDHPMPLCRAVLALVRERARIAGCY